MEIQNSSQETKPTRFVLLGFFVLFCCVGTFFSGFFVSNLLVHEAKPIPASGSANKPTVSPISEQTTKFMPGQHYFDDTIIILTKDEPRFALAASVSRKEEQAGYTQNARLSFFDGKKWGRVTKSSSTSDSTVSTNEIVSSWNITVDRSRVLKQTVNGEVKFKDTPISFQSGVLENEIGMRSLPGYTKFMSEGSGLITINGATHDAYLVYTRIYSLNASDIQFYNEPLGLTTDWLVFWDEQGNFYHIDNTSVEKPTPIYETHQIAVLKDSSGMVGKSFNVQVSHDDIKAPETSSYILSTPISASLQIQRNNMINKAPNDAYSWLMGMVSGNVTTANGENIQGVGIVEYIHN